MAVDAPLRYWQIAVPDYLPERQVWRNWQLVGLVEVKAAHKLKGQMTTARGYYLSSLPVKVLKGRVISTFSTRLPS